MFELTINGNVYGFRFGMGFLREINKKVGMPMDGVPDMKKNMGLQYAVAGLMDGDMEELVNVLFLANKTENPRVTMPMLDEYIEDETTDIDQLFKDLLDFLENANATKTTVAFLKKQVEEAKKNQ